jgi:hypothetical protein
LAGVDIAVLIPCYNEQLSVERVVLSFRAALPQAAIYVYDNNSSDDTAELALRAGAIVRYEPLPGKGNVVRRMFADVEADVLIMVDGDATYDAEAAPDMVRSLLDGKLDMVVGTRLHTSDAEAFRHGHQIGNKLLTGTVAWLFGNRFRDMLSGYRAMSRRFVKSFPSLAEGFEIETELAVHALALHMPVAELETPYYARPEGSASKLRTFRDGWRILRTIVKLCKQERPLLFFGCICVAMAASSLILAAPIFVTYVETGLVPRFPTAILATGIMLLSFLSLACGLILDSVAYGRREMRRLAYLNYKAPVWMSRSRRGKGWLSQNRHEAASGGSRRLSA